MTRIRSTALLLLALLPVTVFGQPQQVIQLKNGSSVKGEIINQDETKLLVRTEYGTLEIPKTNVLSIGYGEALTPATETTQNVTQAASASIPQSTQRDAISQGTALLAGGLDFNGVVGSDVAAVTANYTLASFVARHVALGLDGTAVYGPIGDYFGGSLTMIPTATLMLGGANSSVYGYTSLGIGLLLVGIGDVSAAGYEAKLALGVVPMLNACSRHIGVPVELSLKTGGADVALGIAMKLAGFLF
ncbi:MAG: hypothetical protein NTX53_18750 [candidate division WOR-3 bacterium]|nr:hypothetical protein [candidate division WOR-3 bacterium]